MFRNVLTPRSALLVFLLAPACGLWPVAVPAQPAETGAAAPEPVVEAGLRVAEIVMAQSYDPVAKAPVDTASTFPADIGQVVCFTRVVGARIPVQITHVWYHEGKTKAKVRLPVGSSSWRTFSRKNILPAWTGRWEVKVLDGNGAVLATTSFTVR